MPSTSSYLPASEDYIYDPMLFTKGSPVRTLAPGIPEDAWPNGGGGAGTPEMLNADQSIAKDLVPFIDETYRTRADRDHRAVAGLSGPGAQSLYIGMTNLKTFAWIGVFGGGFPTLPGVDVWIPNPPHIEQYFLGPDSRRTVDPAKLTALMPEMNNKANLRMLYFAMGANDALWTSQNDLMKLLDEKGIKYVSVNLPNQHHDWRSFRTSFVDFAPRVFQNLSD